MVELTLLAFFGRIFLGANAMEDGEEQEWDIEMVMIVWSKWKRSEYDCY
jgi:hypothetical protein